MYYTVFQTCSRQLYLKIFLLPVLEEKAKNIYFTFFVIANKPIQETLL